MQADVSEPFVSYGVAHLVAMCITAAIMVGLPWAIRRLESPRVERWVALSLATAMISHELVKIAVRVWVLDQRLVEQLPLHLCSMGMLLTAFLLIRKNYGAFEVAYFWAMGGTLQAVITPNLRDAFPSFNFFSFFLGHGLVLVGVAYAIVIYGFRPTFRSVLKTIWITLPYMAFAGVLNVLLDTNFLYLRHKPLQPTVIDLLGPWPWYIPSMIGLGVVICLLLYLPFRVLAKREHSTTESPGT